MGFLIFLVKIKDSLASSFQNEQYSKLQKVKLDSNFFLKNKKNNLWSEFCELKKQRTLSNYNILLLKFITAWLEFFNEIYCLIFQMFPAAIIFCTQLFNLNFFFFLFNHFNIFSLRAAF